MPVLCGEMCVCDWEPTMGMADRRKGGVLLNNGAVIVTGFLVDIGLCILMLWRMR